MKKIYALAAVAFMALAANAQNGAPLYATGAGDFVGGSWAPSTADEFTYADGKYTLEVTNLSEFKVSTVLGDWPDFNGGALCCDYGKEPGAVVPLNAGDANIVCPWEGDYTITVAGDLSTICLTTTTPPPSGPAKIYLRGDMNGWGNDPEVLPNWEVEVLSDNVYKYVMKADQVVKATEGFKVATANWSGFNVGAVSSDPVLLETDTEVVNDGGSQNLIMDEEWDGVMYLNMDIDGVPYIWLSNDKTAVPDWYENIGDGVKTVNVENNAVVKYYNLQGVEVANPENGLYIVVKGNETKKVLVK